MKDKTENKQEIKYELDISDISKKLSDLSEFEQNFILHYYEDNDERNAVKKAYELAEKKAPKNTALLSAIARKILLKKSTNQVLEELRKQKAKQFSLAVSNVGNKVLESFKQTADKQKMMNTIQSELDFLETNIVAAKASGDVSLYMQLSKEKRSYIKLLEKTEESVRKNIQVVNEISGTSKERGVISAGSLVINIDNSTSKDSYSDPNSNDIIDMGVIEEEVEL